MSELNRKLLELADVDLDLFDATYNKSLQTDQLIKGPGGYPMSQEALTKEFKRKHYAATVG